MGQKRFQILLTNFQCLFSNPLVLSKPKKQQYCQRTLFTRNHGLPFGKYDLSKMSFQIALCSVSGSIRSLHILNDIQKYAYAFFFFFEIWFSYLNSFNKGIMLSIKAVQFFPTFCFSLNHSHFVRHWKCLDLVVLLFWACPAPCSGNKDGASCWVLKNTISRPPHSWRLLFMEPRKWMGISVQTFQHAPVAMHKRDWFAANFHLFSKSIYLAEAWLIAIMA